MVAALAETENSAKQMRIESSAIFLEICILTVEYRRTNRLRASTILSKAHCVKQYARGNKTEVVKGRLESWVCCSAEVKFAQ